MNMLISQSRKEGMMKEIQDMIDQLEWLADRGKVHPNNNEVISFLIAADAIADQIEKLTKAVIELPERMGK